MLMLLSFFLLLSCFDIFNEMRRFVNWFGALALCLIFLKGSSTECFSDSQTQDFSRSAGTSFVGYCDCKDDVANTLKWFDVNDTEIGPGIDSNVYAISDRNVTKLFISRLSRSDAPYVYKCVAESNGKKDTLVYSITVYDSMYFFDTPEKQFIVKDNDSIITCKVGPVEGSYNVVWDRVIYEIVEPKTNQTSIIDNEKYNVTKEGVIIKKVEEEDGGYYKCEVTNMNTAESIERIINVEVITVPTIQNLQVIPNETLLIGEPLSISCLAEGIPHPNYTWIKLPQSNNTENSSRWRQNLNTIKINKVDAGDRGTYQCVASNEGGEAYAEVFIEVLEPPVIKEFKDLKYTEGSTFVQIDCKARGRPQPVTYIKPENKDLFYDESVNWSQHNVSDTEVIHRITINKLTREHDMFFTCTAKNSISDDEVTKVMHLKVEHKPYILKPRETVWAWIGKNINLTCESKSNPPVIGTEWRFIGNDGPTEENVLINKEILEKTNSSDGSYLPLEITRKSYFGDYECIALNVIGHDNKIIHLKESFLPGPIENVSIISIKPTSVIFNIIGPSEDNPLTGYIAEFDERENFNITSIHNNRTWAVGVPYRIDRLKPNTEYVIRFAAKNELGDGAWNDDLAMSFFTADSLEPDPPTWVHIPSDNVLKWIEPDDNGEPIDYYAIQYCPENEEETNEINETVADCPEIIMHKPNEIKLDFLEPNKTYSFEIRAHNSKGNSSSKAIYITTLARISSRPAALLSAGAIIGLSVVTVFVCLLILDVLLLLWRRKGIIASCCRKQTKKADDASTRDQKGLLKDSADSGDNSLKRPRDRQKEPDSKYTGVITGKHSSV